MRIKLLIELTSCLSISDRSLDDKRYFVSFNTQYNNLDILPAVKIQLIYHHMDTI